MLNISNGNMFNFFASSHQSTKKNSNSFSLSNPQQVTQPQNATQSRGMQLDGNALSSSKVNINGAWTQINVNWSHNSTSDSPTMRVTGTNPDGSQFDKEVRVRDINPKNASAVEMSALNAYLSASSDGRRVPRIPLGLTTITAPRSSNAFSRMDFFTPIDQSARKMHDAGNMQGYMSLRPVSDWLSNWMMRNSAF